MFQFDSTHRAYSHCAFFLASFARDTNRTFSSNLSRRCANAITAVRCVFSRFWLQHLVFGCTVSRQSVDDPVLFFSHAGNANESRRSLLSVTLPVPGPETTCRFASARDRPFPWRFAVSNGVYRYVRASYGRQNVINENACGPLGVLFHFENGGHTRDYHYFLSCDEMHLS